MSSVQEYVKDMVVDELRKKIQTDLGIDKLHFQPFNTIELRKVYLNDKKNNKMLYVDRLYANVDVWALLKKKIEINAVQLSDFDLFLSKETKESELNIQFVLDAFKSESKDTKPLFTFERLSSIGILGGHLTFDVLNQGFKQGIFDENHIEVKDIESRISIKHFSNDSINAHIKNLSLYEKSGFKLENLIVRVVGSREYLAFKGFKLQLPDSSIQLEKCNFSLSGDENDFFEIIKQMRFEIKPATSFVRLSDISAFVPEFTNFNDRLYFSASISGKIDSLSLNNLNLNYENRLNFIANAYVKDVGKKEDLYLLGEIENLTITKDGIQSLINTFSGNPKEIPSQIANLGTVSFKGEISGLLNNLLAKGNLHTVLGEVIMNLHFGFNSAQSLEFFFKGNISTKDFQLGKLLDNKDMDLLSFNFEIDAQKRKGNALEGKIDGLLEQFDFRKYSYKNIEIDGIYSDKKYDGEIFMDDENGYVKMNGLFDFSRSIPVFDFVAHTDNIRLDKLNLTDKYPDSYLSTNIKANFSGAYIDDLQGSLYVDSLNFRRSGKQFILNGFSVTAEGKSDNRLITIESDIIDGVIKGSFTYVSLIDDIRNTLANYMPSILNKKEETVKKNVITVSELDLNLKIGNTEDLSEIFSLPVTVLEPITIQGRFVSFDNNLTLNIDFPSLKAAGINIEKGNIKTYSEKDVLSTVINMDMLSKKNVRSNLNIDLSVENDKFDSHITFSNDNVKQSVKGEIIASTQFVKVDNILKTKINFQPGELVLNDTVWIINKSDFVIFDNSVSANNFVLANKDKSQYLRIDGTYSLYDPSDVLFLNLQNINLEYIFTTLNIDALQFGGYATGVVSASSIDKKPYAKVNLKVRDFSFNQTYLGNLDLFSDLDEETKKVNMKGFITGEEDRRVVDIDGYINPLTQELSLDFDADKVNIAFLNKYAASLFNNVGGKGSGQVRLFGNFSKVTVEGRTFIENGTLNINFLNTTYSFTDSVFLKKDLIYFNDVKLYDTHGSVANVSGKVVHDYFSDFIYQVDLLGENFMLYNVSETQNPLFSGQVFGSGSGSISGDEQDLNIEMRLKTNNKTKVRLNFMEESAAEYSFIIYKPDSEKEEPEKGKVSHKIQSSSGIGINMNFYVEATPDATVEIVMDPVGGDIIKGNGSGSMHFVWGTNSEPLLYGTYVIQSGSYNFTFQKLLERRFIIDSGSSVQFRGDPFMANLDVSAIYRLNANLNDLDQGIASSTGQTSVPVQCILNLTGVLRHPAVKLDIALPTVDAEIQRQVKTLISTEDMINRQMVYLLLLSKFYTPNPSIAENQTSDLASVASATLSAQLSNILNQIDERWQVGANVRTSDFSNNTEVELLLSSHLLNNKLLINGNFGYKENIQNQSAFIRDVDIEYLLGNSNTWRIKAYNHYNDKYYYYQSTDTRGIDTQGVGIMYKRDFDSIKEIFNPSANKKPVNDSTSILPDSTQIGSALGPFIKIK